MTPVLESNYLSWDTYAPTEQRPGEAATSRDLAHW